MKKFLQQYGLLSGMIALFIAIFAVGGMYSHLMTDEIQVRADERAEQQQTAQYLEACQEMFGDSIRIALFTPSTLAKSYVLPGNRGEFTPTIEKAVHVYEGETEIGVVYYVNTFGKNAMILAYGFAHSDFAAKGVVVIDQKETPQYYSTLNPAFFDQFGTATLEDLDFGVDGIAGATYSSKGFEIGWLYAREVYALDYDFTIPVLDMTLLEVSYNLDPATFVSAPFIAEITYGESNTPASVLLSGTFDYVGLVGGGTDLDADLQTAVKSLAAQSGDVSTTASFLSYDAGTRVLVMKTKGYNGGNPIQVTITLTVALDGIESFTVSSHESYDDEYNTGEYGNYEGGAVPAVENAFMNQYQADGSIIDAVAGASQGTSPAMTSMLELLDAFIDELNGGN